MQQMNYHHPERGRPSDRPSPLANGLMVALIVAVVVSLVWLALRPLSH